MPIPPPNSFVPIKTMAEEDAEATNLDSLDDVGPSTGPTVPSAPTDANTEAVPASQFARPSANPFDRRLDAAPRGSSADPKGTAPDRELIEAGARAREKIAEAQPKASHDGDRVVYTSDVKLTDIESKGLAYLQHGDAEVASTAKKAVDESSVPTAAKPFVATYKGATTAMVNTLKAIPIPETQGGSTEGIPSVGGTTGAVIEGGAQFATDFILAGKFLKASKLFAGASKFTQLSAQSAVTDAAAFDPTAPRLSNLVNSAAEESPWLRNPLTEYLAAKPEDSDALSRFKNAIEGFAVGSTLDRFMHLAGAMKNVAVAEAKGGQTAAHAALIEQADTVEKLLEGPSKEVGAAAPAAENAIPVFKDAPLPSPQEDLLKSAADDYIKKAQGPDFDMVFNHDQIKGSSDMRAVLEMIGQKAADKVDLKAVQPLADLEAMADEMGTSSADIQVAISEFAKNADQANAVVFAARKTQNAIANEIVKEARKASEGSNKARLNGLVLQLQNLQEALLPARRAQARGLRAWGHIADDSFSMQQIQSIIASGGNPGAIRKAVQAKNGLQRGFGAFMGYYCNALLSSPATHERNIVGNFTNMLFKPTMRLAGSALSLDVPAMGESLAHFTGLAKGFTDSFLLMKKAFMTNEPILTRTSKGEGMISGTSAKALGLDPTTTFGWMVDGVDKVVSLPGRFLTGADEFAKQINYRASRYASLTREATDKSLVGDSAGLYVKQGMDASFDAAKIAGKDVKGVANNAESLDYALHAAYQEKPGYIGQAALDAANRLPPVRLIVPFIKTLNNITRQAVEFSPGPWASTKWWGDIKAGGMRRKEAIGKLTLGTGACYLISSKVADGTITGSGPKDPALRKNLMATGWRPNSIKIGNEYHSYTPLGHVGTMMAMVSTFCERVGGFDENAKSSFAAHAVSAFADAMSSQTFAQGFSNAVEAMQDDNAMQKFLQSQAGSLVPAIVNDIREGTDTTKRSPQGFDEAFLNRLPWASKEVPSAYNTLGEHVMLNAGVGPEEFAPWMNAMTIHSFSERKGDPVLEEFERLQRPFDAIPRYLKLNEQQVDLGTMTNDKGQTAYARWNELLTTHRSGASNRGGGGKTLREAMEALIASPRYQALPSDVRPGIDGERVVEVRNLLAGYRRETEGALNKEFPQLQALKSAAKQDAAKYRNEGSAGLGALQNLLTPK
jgi:hypothetical protein